MVKDGGVFWGYKIAVFTPVFDVVNRTISARHRVYWVAFYAIG